MATIFTKTGDSGQTSLYGGKRVKKSDNIIDAIGSVDELNSLMGLLQFELLKENFQDYALRIQQIQESLFVLGADLASPYDANMNLRIKRIEVAEVLRLENEMNIWEQQLPELKHFILPRGSKAALQAYYARAVCRRAERAIVQLAETREINMTILQYLNRLGDWLFELFRVINHAQDETEHLWLP